MVLEEKLKEKLNSLNNDYNDKEPINFHYVDTDGSEDEIEVDSNDINYERAYNQQKSLLELELNYYNKSSINYNGELVNYSSENYNKAYEEEKKRLNNLSILNTKEEKEEEKNKIQENLSKVSEDDVDKLMNEVYESVEAKNLEELNCIIFEKDNNIYIVGNSSSDLLWQNYSKLDSDIIKPGEWNNQGKKIFYAFNDGQSISTSGVKVSMKNGSLDIDGDVDKIEYFENGKKVVKNDTKDYSGLDVIPPIKNNEEIVSNGSLNSDISGLDVMPEADEVVENKQIIPVTAKKVENRKQAKPSLIEKFKNLKGWKKAAIVAGIIALIGAAAAAIYFSQNPDALNNLIQTITGHSNVVTQVSNASSQLAPADAAVSTLDYSSFGGSDHTVFTNAVDAVNGTNGLVSNEWFSNNPLDVFNTATGQYMGLSPEQLNNPELMQQLAQDPNNAVLFGNSMSDADGFMKLSDVVTKAADVISKVR